MKLYDMRTSPSLGKWGRMHKLFLMKNQPEVFAELVRNGNLNSYLRAMNRQAQERMNLMMKQGIAYRGMTEELKKQNPMEWVRQMNAIRVAAEEIVKEEIIYR